MLRPLALALALSLPAHADPVREAIEDYLDFATYGEGVILPEQLTPDILGQVVFFDTRNAADYAAGHIEGARHLEWREIAARLDDVPETGMVVFYCDTAVLSSQAMFAARVMGRSNVLVLQGGLEAWQNR